MGTRSRLYLGFGTLTALLALFSITVIVDLRGIQADLHEQSEVARVRSATARQMEIHLLGFALAARSYLHLGSPNFLDDARAEAGALGDRIAHYAKLSKTPRQRELGARFAAAWQTYRESVEQTVKSGRAASAQQLQDLVGMRVALEKTLRGEIQAEAQASYAQIKDATANRVQALVRLAGFLLVLGVAISAATAFVVSRSVLRSGPP